MLTYKKFYLLQNTSQKFSLIKYNNYLLNFTSDKKAFHSLFIYNNFRNIFATLVDTFSFTIVSKSFKSLLNLNIRRGGLVVYHLFAEVLAYHIIAHKINILKFNLRGSQRYLFYFLKWIFYSVHIWSKKFCKFSQISIRNKATFTSLRQKKWPRRKRRLLNSDIA